MFRLFSKLFFGTKFVLLGVLALLAVLPPAGLYWSAAGHQVDQARLEQRGVPLVTHLLALVRLTQEHRGLTTSALAGNPKAVAARPAKQAEVDRAVGAFVDAVSRAQDDVLNRRWEPIRREWTGLAKKVGSGGATSVDAFDLHTVLLAKQLSLLQEVVDRFGWALDPQSETYFTMLAVAVDGPKLTELLGQMRALGARALSRRPLTRAIA